MRFDNPMRCVSFQEIRTFDLSKRNDIMKRFSCFLLMVIFLLCIHISSFADSVILPNKLGELEEECFYRNKNVTIVVVPNGTRTVGTRAFAFSGLQRIFLPESVKSIDTSAFYGLPADFTIYVPEDSYSLQFAVDNNYHYVVTSYDVFILFLSESERLTEEYNEEYNALSEELKSLQNSKFDADEAVKQAQLDLDKLPKEKNAFITDRTYYYFNSRIEPSSYYARKHAERDWEQYYKLRQSNLNSTINSNTEISEELSVQINAKQNEIDSLTRNYNNNISNLWNSYPNSKK